MIQKELYNTALPASGQWISSWFDNGLTLGEVMAVISVYSDQYGQFWIQETDDVNNPLMYLPGMGITTVRAGGVSVQMFPVRHLFWRVIYDNGVNAQTNFEIVVSASVSDMAAVLVELQRINFQLRRLVDPYTAKDETFNVVTGSL
jgi:hypothetical protein